MTFPKKVSDISDPDRGVIRGSIHDLPWAGHCQSDKAILRKLLRDGVERTWAFPISEIPSWTKHPNTFFVCPLLLLSIFLHPKKTIFVKSVRVLLFPCISSCWWVHFPHICSILNIKTRKQLRVFGVNPFFKAIKLQLTVINENVFIWLPLGCVQCLECLKEFFHVSSKRSEHSTHPNRNWIRIFLSSFNWCFVALKKGLIPKIRSFCIVVLAFFLTDCL